MLEQPVCLIKITLPEIILSLKKEVPIDDVKISKIISLVNKVERNEKKVKKEQI
jgi:hypothetical protein